MPITTGTKTPDTLSAIFAIGALVAAASLTILMICESVVSSPMRVALHFKNPDWFMVAAFTVSPAVLSTGMLSPVRADSFTAELPSKIKPSTGMLSPGRTANISPILSSSTGMVCSTPSLMTLAVFGASFIRLLRASVVRPLEWASRVFPTVMRVSIMAADSK